MQKNQKTAIFGILTVTVILAILVFVTTGNSPSASNESGDGSHEHSEQEKKDGKHDTEKSREKGAGEPKPEETDAVVLTEEQITSANVVIATAGPEKIITTLTLPGEIRFNQDRTSHIVPRIDGIAESVTAELGQKVKKNQVLAILASTSISELRSESMAAQKRMTLAKTTYEREKKLWEDKISAEQDYLQARQTLQEAEIAAQNASQKLRALGAGNEAKGGLNRYELRAPFDGMIVERHLSLGEAVQANANVITLSDLSTVWAEIVVSAKDLNTVKAGTSATVKAASFESQAQGKISYVGSLLGEQTRTATARVTLANPDNAWRPGLFVNVEIVSGEVNAPVTVNTDAIQSIENKNMVFVRTEEGFKAVPVETGRSDGKFVEITKGLEAGTRYASKGSFVLKSELGKASAEHGH